MPEQRRADPPALGARLDVQELEGVALERGEAEQGAVLLRHPDLRVLQQAREVASILVRRVQRRQKGQRAVGAPEERGDLPRIFGDRRPDHRRNLEA